MTPLEFLQKELENTDRALSETLAHNYGPGRREEYYVECESRLKNLAADIKKLADGNRGRLKSAASELGQVSHAIALVERSRLGEFSWPFAYQLRDAAKSLLSEVHAVGKSRPIVQIIADAIGYKIRTENRLRHTRSRFVTIHFPRQLKHHVLLHALFGHELGHAAIHIPDEQTLLKKAIEALTSSGPLSSPEAVNRWLNRADAPADVKAGLKRIKSKGPAFKFHTAVVKNWQLELVCDLFGVACFGPAFVAAHRAYLGTPYPYTNKLFDSSHPPFAYRHMMLCEALQLFGWGKAVTSAEDKNVHAAEKALIAYVCEDAYVPWAQLFTKGQLTRAIGYMQRLTASHPKLAYRPVPATVLSKLVKNLANGVPPVLSPIDELGVPTPKRVPLGAVLYAGWIYWLGRFEFPRSKLSFFEINRLCDQALIQQAAITHVLSRRRS